MWVPSSVSWWYHYVGGMKQETVVRVRWTAAQTWQPLSFRNSRYTLRRSSIQVFLGLWAPNKSFVSVLETLPAKLRIHMCNLRSRVCRVNTVESWLGAEGFAVSSRSFFNYPFPSGSLHDLFLVPHPQASVVLFCFFPLTSFSPLGECCGELWSKPQWLLLLGLTNGRSQKLLFSQSQMPCGLGITANFLKKKNLEYSK